MKIVTSDKLASASGIKCLVYGRAGVGKTTLCATAPRPILISAESGLLSIAHLKIPVIEIYTFEDLMEAYSWVTDPKNQGYFDSIGMDSLSEIAEKVLAAARKKSRDGRQVYGEIIEKMLPMIKGFRDIKGKNVIFTAKEGTQKDGATGVITHGPDAPGQELPKQLPYLFDTVFHMGVMKDQNGTDFRYLRTQPDFKYEAKDRSGKLAELEYPDLSAIFAKMSS